MMISVIKKYIHNLTVFPKTLIIHIFRDSTSSIIKKSKMTRPESNHTWTCLYKMMMHNNSKNYRCKVAKSFSLQNFFMISNIESNEPSSLSLFPSPLTLLTFFKHFLLSLSAFSASHDEKIKINTYEWPVQSVWIATNYVEICFPNYC